MSPTHRGRLRRLVVATAVACGVTLAGAVTTGGPAIGADQPIDPTQTAPVERAGSDLESPPARTAVTAPAADRVLVRFAPGSSSQERRSTLSAAGIDSSHAVGATGFVSVSTGDEDPQSVADELADDPDVASVQLDHVRSAAAWTDDELVSETWQYLDLMRFPRAWDISTGAGAVVAVLDTGIRTDHEDLVGRVLPGYDFVTDTPGAAGTGRHGTLVAGIAAESGNNRLGNVGAAYGAQLLPVRVLDDDGNGYDSDVAQGITWAADRHADVINLSLSGPSDSPVLLAAIQYAVARGSVVVAAAGNSGTDAPEYPGAYSLTVPGLLTVSSTDDDGTVLPTSTWGDDISVAAPGYQIVGTSWASTTAYTYDTGTSMAAPFVSGVAALLASAHPTWTPKQIADRIAGTARDAGPFGVDPYYGHGVLDAAAALGAQPAVPLDRTTTDVGARNDLPATATPLTLGQQVMGDLNGLGDVDWWRFDADPGFDYTISSTLPGTRGSAPIVRVTDAEGQEITPYHGQYHSMSGGAVFVQVGAGGTAPGPRYTMTVTASSTPRSADQLRFDPVQGSILFDGSGTASLADVTGDGIDDVVATGTTVGGDGFAYGAVSVGIGAQDGTFTSSRVQLARGLGGTYALCNVSGDAVPEVVASSDSAVHVVSAAGGTLGAPTTLATGLPAADVLACLDLDADGDPDVVVMTGSGVTILRNTGSIFTAEPPLSALKAAVAVLDVDGDARPDILLSGGLVALQRADGSFADPTVGIPALVGSVGARLADLDGDGRTDVTATAGGVLRMVRATGAGTWGASIDGPAATDAFQLSDLNGDGRADVLLTKFGYILAYALQTDAGTFGPSMFPRFDGIAPSPRTAIAGDVNHDGRPDLVLVDDHTLSVAPAVDVDDTPGTKGWVWSVDPAADASGVGVRPAVTVVSPRMLGAAAVDGVRLIDGATGAEVPVDRAVSAAADRVTVTPKADLAVGGHYEIRVSALVDQDGAVMTETSRSWFTVGAGGDRFTPLDPVRVTDTRGYRGPVGPTDPLDIDLGFFVPPSATAVVLNVTAVNPSAPGDLRAYPRPDGSDVLPLVSNLNVVAGVNQPNMVTVKLSSTLGVRIAARYMSAHVVVDLAGYYSPDAVTGYVPVEPVRVMDQRNGTGGVAAQRLAAGHWVDLQVAGRQGVPASASAVVLNVLGIDPSAGTDVRVYPAPAASESQDPPTVSNLNIVPGRDQPNLVTVLVGDGGKVRFYAPNANVFLVADLAGYYAPTGSDGFVPVSPTRIADTRVPVGLPGGRVQPGQVRTLAVSGTALVPADATAVALNVTAVLPGGKSNLRVFPVRDGSVPLVSNLNVVAGRNEPNMVLVPVGTGGGVSFYSQTADLNLVVDVAGFFRSMV